MEIWQDLRWIGRGTFMCTKTIISFVWNIYQSWEHMASSFCLGPRLLKPAMVSETRVHHNKLKLVVPEVRGLMRGTFLDQTHASHVLAIKRVRSHGCLAHCNVFIGSVCWSYTIFCFITASLLTTSRASVCYLIVSTAVSLHFISVVYMRALGIFPTPETSNFLKTGT